ncbi:MAG: glycosyltransferase [Candidatus Methanomethylophilaceae archaeon]|nr:glycosyltransferase [Candidatus Methanomethylophilaceae archaeon]
MEPNSPEIKLKKRLKIGRKHKISVIIPIFNKEDYLDECLNTVENQTLKDIEIICINDGSTDNSLNVIKEHADKDRRVQVINQNNMGVGKTRDKGIELSNSEFICFMDPDDYYPSDDVLETLYSVAKENRALIAGGSWSEDHNGKIKIEFSGIYQKYIFKENGFVDYKDYQFDYGYHRFIYDRKMIVQNNIYFPPYKRYQDPPFFVKAMITAGSFYSVTKQTYRYRYGHQKVEWKNKEVCDGLISGLIDNLRLSSEYRLGVLHKLTVDRLNNEYSKYLIDAVINEEGTELFDLIKKANNCVDRELLTSIVPEIRDNYSLPVLVKATEALNKRQTK